jgi:hypothetical protein
MTVHRIANADRPRVQADIASRLLAVTEADIRGTHPAPGGTMWRLRALVAMGHTCSRIAAAIGVPPATLRRIVRGEALTITPQVHQAVTALFEVWWDKNARNQKPGSLMRARPVPGRPPTRSPRRPTRARHRNVPESACRVSGTTKRSPARPSQSPARRRPNPAAQDLHGGLARTFVLIQG